MPREDLDTFWVALVIIRNGEYGTLPLRRWYYQNFPTRVEDAVAFLGIWVGVRSKRQAEKNGTAWKTEVTESLNKSYDPGLHERIWAKIREESWINLENERT